MHSYPHVPSHLNQIYEIPSTSSSCLCAKCFPSPSRRRDLSHDDSTEAAIDSNRFHHQMSANVSCIRATHAHRTAMSKLSPALALKHVIHAAPSKRSRSTGQAKLERILQDSSVYKTEALSFKLCARLCPSLRMSVTKASGLLQPKGLMKLPRATTGSCRHTTGFQQMSRKKWDKILVTSHPLSWDLETLALNKTAAQKRFEAKPD